MNGRSSIVVVRRMAARVFVPGAALGTVTGFGAALHDEFQSPFSGLLGTITHRHQHQGCVDVSGELKGCGHYRAGDMHTCKCAQAHT